MGIMFGIFSFVFQVFSTQECEAVILSKFELVCVHAGPLKYLDTPYLFRAHTPCMCIGDAHAQHDITRSAYDTDRGIMTSLAFTFHL